MMKKNRGNLLPINFRCQDKFSRCSFAKNKPSVDEVEEEEKEKEEKRREKEMKKFVEKNLVKVF
jgi:hypothetical protein